MMEVYVAYLVSHWQEVLALVTSVVGTFALLATMTPNKSDDRVVQMVLDVVNFVGANWGKAKNDPKVD